MRSWSKRKPPYPHDATVKRKSIPPTDPDLTEAVRLLIELGGRAEVRHPYWLMRKNHLVKVSTAASGLKLQLRKS